MKIILAPDSYKDSIDSKDVALAMEKGICRVLKDAKIYRFPMADGGEGTVETIVNATGGEIRKLAVSGPLGNKIESFYGILSDGKTAVIEMAAASGIMLLKDKDRNPMYTTTYGTGELIKDAIDFGCSKIVIGIGGSATNDGGMGMAQALGVRFYGKDNRELGFGGKELNNIINIDLKGLDLRINEVEIEVACDVTNYLCGKNGASYVYGMQKGANKKMIKELDKGLGNFANVVEKVTGKDIRYIRGAGAAGGLGAGLFAFLDAKIKSGVETILDIYSFDEIVQSADLVITGEGKTDSQTVNGKVPIGVARKAKEYKVPVICLSGSIDGYNESLYKEGITAIFSILDRPMELKMAVRQSNRLIEKATENIIRVYLSKK